jgi:2-hydroxyacyl-CoA lyase 1
MAIRNLIDSTNLPFLPSPMAKGVVPDSQPQIVSSARSTALKMADVVLILGARLNWIFHYGEPPKWNPAAKFIQVDIAPEEMGRNVADAELSLLGDVSIVVQQLSTHLANWSYNPLVCDYAPALQVAKQKNEATATRAANDPSIPLTYARAFDVIKKALHDLSPPSDGGICYVAEGANTMDISRSIFQLEYPRLRLDAGTYATMGVGLPYAIAAWEAYNGSKPQVSLAPSKRKKIVAIEGDSAFGFSGMEVETMARMGMDILIFVINNGGIYFGDSNSKEDWSAKQKRTMEGKVGLRSWALGWEVKYEKLAEACGGMGFFVRTPEELEKATIAGFNAKVPVIVNVIIQSGKAEKPVSPLSMNVRACSWVLIMNRASGGKLRRRKKLTARNYEQSLQNELSRRTHNVEIIEDVCCVPAGPIIASQSCSFGYTTWMMRYGSRPALSTFTSTHPVHFDSHQPSRTT